jgi:hypothetical protein
MSEERIPVMFRTVEAAKLLHRAPQTLRLWAYNNKGPLKPIRVNGPRGPLLWSKAEIIRVLNGEPKEPEGGD